MKYCKKLEKTSNVKRGKYKGATTTTTKKQYAQGISTIIWFFHPET